MKIRVLIYATLVILIVRESAIADIDYCTEVAEDFLPCISYIAGLSSEPALNCCGGLGWLNEKARQNNRGPNMICQCIEDMAYVTNLPFVGSRIGDLSAKCRLHLSFPISVRMDCSRQLNDNDLGLFAIFDGHLGHGVANYLQNHLFDNILKEHDFWTDIENAIRRAYRATDAEILDKAFVLGKGGSTAVTAILINGEKLVVANVGDSRAVICKNGAADQLSIDHSKEKRLIESRGGFVSNLPGDVPRVDGQLAVARTFGDKSLKIHLSSDPDVKIEIVDDNAEFILLASDGIWKVMSNQEAVGAIKNIKDSSSAAKHLIEEAKSRKSKDDISCIVVKLR